MKWLKEDGTLDLDALDTLAANVKAATDSNAGIDAIIKAERLGAPKVIAFRCGHTGQFYPADYAKEWGRKYGIGLGDQVVSESLDSQYHVPVSDIKNLRKMEQLMHPVSVSGAQVDYIVVPQVDFEAAQLIIDLEDTDQSRRGKIIFQKQLVHPDSQLRLVLAQFNAFNKKVIV